MALTATQFKNAERLLDHNFDALRREIDRHFADKIEATIAAIEAQARSAEIVALEEALSKENRRHYKRLLKLMGDVPPGAIVREGPPGGNRTWVTRLSYEGREKYIFAVQDANAVEALSMARSQNDRDRQAAHERAYEASQAAEIRLLESSLDGGAALEIIKAPSLADILP